MDNTLLTIGLAATLLTSIVSLILAIKKAPFDIKKLLLANRNAEVDLTAKYEKQLGQMATYNLNLRNEIQGVRAQMDDMSKRHSDELEELRLRYDKEMTEIREALTRTEKRAQLVEDWASRLCSQVESLGEVPVPFDLSERKTQPRK